MVIEDFYIYIFIIKSINTLLKIMKSISKITSILILIIKRYFEKISFFKLIFTLKTCYSYFKNF